METSDQKHHSTSSAKILIMQTDLSLAAQVCGRPQNAAASVLTHRFFIGRCMNNIIKMLTVVFGVLSAGLALAQPQAPITWGEARLLQDASDEVDILTYQTWAFGDTIVLIGVIDWPEADILSRRHLALSPPHSAIAAALVFKCPLCGLSSADRLSL
jgi:hypothetical protein